MINYYTIEQPNDAQRDNYSVCNVCGCTSVASHCCAFTSGFWPWWVFSPYHCSGLWLPSTVKDVDYDPSSPQLLLILCFRQEKSLTYFLKIVWDHNKERSTAIVACIWAHEKKKNAISCLPVSSFRGLGWLVNLLTRWLWQWHSNDVDRGNYCDKSLGEVCLWIFTILGGRHD